MEDLFIKLNSKFTAYNWHKTSRISNDEIAEKIKAEIIEILSNQIGCRFKSANGGQFEKFFLEKEEPFIEKIGKEDWDNNRVFLPKDVIEIVKEYESRLSA